MERLFIITGSIFALTGVGLGAFGAHALRSRLSAEMVSVYQTAVQYQFFHSLGLILIGILLHQAPDSHFYRAGGWMMAVGTILFSGSLYILAISGIRSFGVITPVGGLCLILAWGCIIVGAFRSF